MIVPDRTTWVRSTSDPACCGHRRSIDDPSPTALLMPLYPLLCRRDQLCLLPGVPSLSALHAGNRASRLSSIAASAGTDYMRPILVVLERSAAILLALPAIIAYDVRMNVNMMLSQRGVDPTSALVLVNARVKSDPQMVQCP